MKSIKLTEKQKENLLEMCEILFPEYTLILFDNQSNYYLENEEILSFYNDNEIIQIHWFEFCMTHLCDKIASNLTNEMCTGMPQYYDESEKLDWNSQSLIGILKLYHPIDYLYSEFLKLSK